MKKLDIILTKKGYRDLKKNNIVIATITPNGIILVTIIVKTIRGKLGFKQQLNDEQFLGKSEAIYTALFENKNGLYSTVFSKLDLLNSQNKELAKAVAAIKQGGLGLEGKKNGSKKNVYKTLISALAYINDLCRDDQDNAVNIITGCTMIQVKESTNQKQDFAVKQGKATGEIILTALAEKINTKYLLTTYMWQFSIDGGKSWLDLEPTLKAKTVATGTVIGLATLFRKRTKTTENGMSKWCTPISIVPQ